MDRCWLKGSEGDALHAVLFAAGFNIRWLLRAITRQAAKATSLALQLVALYAGLALWAGIRLLVGHPARIEMTRGALMTTFTRLAPTTSRATVGD
jgi:hypothetical protein